MADTALIRAEIDAVSQQARALQNSIQTLSAQLLSFSFMQGSIDQLSQMSSDQHKRIMVLESEVRTLKARLQQEGQGGNVIPFGKDAS